MLSQDTINKINDQIRNELREVDTSFNSNEDKMAALERMSALTALLTPQPTRQDLLNELALALKEQNAPTPSPLTAFGDLLAITLRK